MRSAHTFDCRRPRIKILERCASLRHTAGGALIELAVMLPVFMALLIGASEYAVLAYDAIEVSNAARAGVAYGSQSTTAASNIAGMRAAALADGPDVSGLAATPSELWSCSNAPATLVTPAPTCGSGNHLLNYVKVTTTASVKPWMHLPGLPTTYTLTGLSIMRVQQ
jgi:Flp pilus assembly protein TadG